MNSIETTNRTKFLKLRFSAMLRALSTEFHHGCPLSMLRYCRELGYILLVTNSYQVFTNNRRHISVDLV
jgi:hypothetical protein